MQLAIYIECDGNISIAQIYHAVHEVARLAGNALVAKGVPAIDHAHELDTAAMPHVWNAQLHRHA